MIKCYTCNCEMKQIQNSTVLIPNCIIHKGDGFGISDRESSIHSNTYVCPKCGLIQQYVPKDELKYLNDI